MSLRTPIAGSIAAGLILSGIAAPQSHAVSAYAPAGTCVMNFTTQEQREYGLDATEKMTMTELDDQITSLTNMLDLLLLKREHAAESPKNASVVAELDLEIIEIEGAIRSYKVAVSQCKQNKQPPKTGKGPAQDQGKSKPDNGKNPDDGKGENALSTEDGKLNDAGIGVVVAGVLLVVLGGIAAALPTLKPMLPANIAAMLP